MSNTHIDAIIALCDEALSDRVTVIDADGTVLATTSRDYAERHGFVPATDNRMLHPQLAKATREAANTPAHDEFWADVATMPEPEGIRS